MNISKIFLYCLFFFGFNASFSFAQNNTLVSDTLINKSYNYIYNEYLKIYEDTLKSRIYLNSYLYKASHENKSLRKAVALTHLSYYSDNEEDKLKLLDSAIIISNTIENKIYPILAYTFKAGYFLEIGNYEKALNIYLQALAISEQKNNTQYTYIIKHNIALIKSDIGKVDEALDLFRECLVYEKSRPFKERGQDYYSGLVDVSESYIKNKKYDSASIYIKEGLLNTKEENSDLYAYFLINNAMNLHYQKKISLSNKNLKLALSVINKESINNSKSLILIYKYFGKNNLLLGQEEETIRNYRIVDSLIKKNNMYLLEFRDSYISLIDQYKKNSNYKEQINFINKLLTFDSIVNTKTGVLSKKLNRDYDTPVLLKEKENLINKLENEKKKLNFWIYILVAIVVLILLILRVNYAKNLKYRRKFDELLKSNEISENKTIVTPKEKETLKINPEIVERVLEQLNRFEMNNKFLDSSLTIVSLAKDFKTNQKYLSKIVNHYKHMSFSKYVNELRINYAVDNLKDDPSIRKYNIRGIASKFGFNTPESFSTAFTKKTGIKPSYFIRQLNRLNKK